MPEPYDYTSAFANLPGVGDSILGGVKNGVSLNQLQAQQQQQQAALAQQQQQKQVVQSLVNNPNATADDYAKAAVLVPQLSAQFKQAWETKSTAQQQADLSNLSQWSAAIQNKQPQIASQGMRDQADAIENTAGGPTPSSKALRAKADQVDANPDAANVILKSMIFAHPNGKAVVDNIVAQNKDQREQDLAPSAVDEAKAKAAGAQSDVALKNAGIVGQTLGSLQGKSAKPAQAYTAIASLQSRGLLSADDAATLKASVPTDGKALDDWFGQQRAAGMKPDEQQKYVSPTAGEKLQSDTTRRGQDIGAQTAAARLKFDKDQADAADAPDTTSDAEKKNWVHQYVAGNGAVPRSAPANVRNHVGTWAAEMGITPADLSSGFAQTKFDQAAAGTSGHRAGSMASVEATMPALTANARELSNQLGQGNFVPLNKLIQMANDKISDPKLAAFKIAHQAVVSEYQQVISRGGTNVTALNEAMHALNSARSAEAYNAALNQVDKEVGINVAGTKAVRAGLGGQHGATPATAATPAATTHPSDISALLKKYGGQ